MFAPFRLLAFSGLVLIALGSSSLAAEPQVPTAVIRPLEQAGLSGFTRWLKKTQHDDPQQVFQLHDGVLRCGDEDLGYVATKAAYRDFHLSVEYRWGRKNQRDKYVRNSGVLLNAIGPDGSASGVWMTSIECQLAQGCEGDLIVIPGRTATGKPFPASITCNTILAADGKTRWSADGKKSAYAGKQFWWSKHQPDFKELIDTRGRDDVASPLGEWTKVECICNGAKITVKINEVTVNECYDANPPAGKILLQAEGHEVFFRNLEIRPLAER